MPASWCRLFQFDRDDLQLDQWLKDTSRKLYAKERVNFIKYTKQEEIYLNL